VSDVQALLAALNSPIRREILWLVWGEEMPAGRIAAEFDVRSPTISEHLNVLLDAGLVSVRREGTFRHYRARQDVLHGLQALVFAEHDKWVPVADPGPSEAEAGLDMVVRAHVDVELAPEGAFHAFNDGPTFSAWLGVPVRLDAGRFACTTQFGTRVRGRYDVIVEPRLLVLRWDFEDDVVPVPGRELLAYVWFAPVGTDRDGARPVTRVEVQQVVGDAKEAEFMGVAWTFVLGHLERWARTARPG
jgi:DNA-binding transcriptional ArsR family regulator